MWRAPSDPADGSLVHTPFLAGAYHCAVAHDIDERATGRTLVLIVAVVVRSRASSGKYFDPPVFDSSDWVSACSFHVAWRITCGWRGGAGEEVTPMRFSPVSPSRGNAIGRASTCGAPLHFRICWWVPSILKMLRRSVLSVCGAVLPF